MVKFKGRDESTDNDIAKLEDVSEADSVGKPSWVNLTQLEAAATDSILDKLVFKPALRFHGLTGGFWGQNVAPSIATDSRPPSYRVSVSGTSTKFNEPCSTCEPGSMYSSSNVPAVSPLTLRRRNTLAVVLIAVALLATIAAITGIVLYYMQPKEMLRANVYFTIANRNFTEDMTNKSSLDFDSIAKPICSEMDLYFLTSELAEFYLQCSVVSLRQNETKPGLAVHFTLDFDENKVTNDGDRIRNIILKKSGRLESQDTLYLVVKDFLVYLKSLRVDLEVQPKPENIPYRPRIPWHEDDYIARKSDTRLQEGEPLYTSSLTNRLFTLSTNITRVPKTILAGAKTHAQNVLYPSMYNPSAATVESVRSVVETALPVLHVMVTGHSVLLPNALVIENNINMLQIKPSKASNFRKEISDSNNVNSEPNDSSELPPNFLEHSTKTFPMNIRPKKVGENNVRNKILDSQFPPDMHVHPSEMLANEVVMKNVQVDKNEIGLGQLIPNELVIDKNNTENNLNSNYLFETSFTSLAKGSDHDLGKQTNILPNNVNREKVLTIFTDVFVILGKNSQTDAVQNFKSSEANIEMRYETQTVNVSHKLDVPVVQESVQDNTLSEVNFPQPSFSTVVDDTFKAMTSVRSAATSTSFYSKIDGTLIPAEITPPKTLKEHVHMVTEFYKLKAGPGRKLARKPNVIVIHTNRNQRNREFPIVDNPRVNVESIDTVLANNQERHLLPKFTINEIQDEPKLFEMQEVSFPRVPTNQTLDIQWFNVLNVPSKMAKDEGRDAIPKLPDTPNEIKHPVVNLPPKRPTTFSFKEAIPIDILNDSNSVYPIFAHKRTPTKEKAFLPTPIQVGKKFPGNTFHRKSIIKQRILPPANAMMNENIPRNNKVNDRQFKEEYIMQQQVTTTTPRSILHKFNNFVVAIPNEGSRSMTSRPLSNFSKAKVIPGIKSTVIHKRPLKPIADTAFTKLHSQLVPRNSNQGIVWNKSRQRHREVKMLPNKNVRIKQIIPGETQGDTIVTSVDDRGSFQGDIAIQNNRNNISGNKNIPQVAKNTFSSRPVKTFVVRPLAQQKRTNTNAHNVQGRTPLYTKQHLSSDPNTDFDIRSFDVQNHGMGSTNKQNIDIALNQQIPLHANQGHNVLVKPFRQQDDGIVYGINQNGVGQFRAQIKKPVGHDKNIPIKTFGQDTDRILENNNINLGVPINTQIVTPVSQTDNLIRGRFGQKSRGLDKNNNINNAIISKDHFVLPVSGDINTMTGRLSQPKHVTDNINYQNSAIVTAAQRGLTSGHNKKNGAAMFGQPKLPTETEIIHTNRKTSGIALDAKKAVYIGNVQRLQVETTGSQIRGINNVFKNELQTNTIKKVNAKPKTVSGYPIFFPDTNGNIQQNEGRIVDPTTRFRPNYPKTNSFDVFNSRNTYLKSNEHGMQNGSKMPITKRGRTYITRANNQYIRPWPFLAEKGINHNGQNSIPQRQNPFQSQYRSITRYTFNPSTFVYNSVFQSPKQMMAPKQQFKQYYRTSLNSATLDPRNWQLNPLPSRTRTIYRQLAPTTQTQVFFGKTPVFLGRKLHPYFRSYPYQKYRTVRRPYIQNKCKFIHLL